MKSLKLMIGVLLVVFAIGSAFTAHSLSSSKAVVSKAVTDHYYRYVGPDNSNAAIQNASNWVYLGQTPPSLDCVESSGIICFIKTDMDESTFFGGLSSQTEASLSALVQARRE